MMRITALKNLHELLSIKRIKLYDFLAQLSDGRILLIATDLLLGIRRDVFCAQVIWDSRDSEADSLEVALERLKANSGKKDFIASVSCSAVRDKNEKEAFKLLYATERVYRKEWNWALAELHKKQYLLEAFRIPFPVEVCKDALGWINSTLGGKYNRLETLLDLRDAFSSGQFWTALASALTGVPIRVPETPAEEAQNHSLGEDGKSVLAKKHISEALGHLKEYGCELYLSANGMYFLNLIVGFSFCNFLFIILCVHIKKFVSFACYVHFLFHCYCLDLMHCRIKTCAMVCELLRINFMANIMLLKIGKPVVVREPGFYAPIETEPVSNEELDSVEAQLNTLLLAEDGHSPSEEQKIEALLGREKELLMAQQNETLSALSGNLLKKIGMQDNCTQLEVASSLKLRLDRLEELVSTVEQEMLFNYEVQCEKLTQSTPPPTSSSSDASALSDLLQSEAKDGMVLSSSPSKAQISVSTSADEPEKSSPTENDLPIHSPLLSSSSVTPDESGVHESKSATMVQLTSSHQANSERLTESDDVPAIASSIVPNKNANAKTWVYSSPSTNQRKGLNKQQEQ